jgi:dienelactone hydrolase
VREVLLGTDNCTHVTCDELKINDHPQDAAVNRLLKALEWAAATHPGDGWERYLTANGKVDWTKINLAGWSNGSSFASLMGMLFPSVGRVTVFSGPNDGKGSSENNWVSADYIQNVPGLTDTRYYGLVHELNKAEVDDNGIITSVLYRIAKNWKKFGMGPPLNASPFYFDPMPGDSPDFGNAHMLISTNPTTDYAAAHGSVVYGRECSKFDDAHTSCDEFKGDWIGYDAAWLVCWVVATPVSTRHRQPTPAQIKRLSVRELAAPTSCLMVRARRMLTATFSVTPGPDLSARRREETRRCFCRSEPASSA